MILCLKRMSFKAEYPKLKNLIGIFFSCKGSLLVFLLRTEENFVLNTHINYSKILKFPIDIDKNWNHK